MERKEVIEATCPECRGPITEFHHGDAVFEYRCAVGHSYSPKEFLVAHAETEERTLWAAVVALEESATMVQRVAPLMPDRMAARLREQAAKKLGQAAEVRRVIEQLEAFQFDE